MVQLGSNMWDDTSDTLRLDKPMWDEYMQHLQKQGVNMLLVDIAEGLKYKCHPELSAKDAWSREYFLAEIEKLRGMGWRKLYMMFGLTDETYALLSSANPPEGVKTHYFYFWIALLNHSYWLVGSVIGAVAGQLLGFDTTGVDFAMTALFIVIAIDQWKSYPRHLPALLGAVATVVCLALFGQENMLVPALAIIVLVLTLARPHLDHTKTKGADAV